MIGGLCFLDTSQGKIISYLQIISETIGECIENVVNTNVSKIEKTKQDFEKLKIALGDMIPKLDGFDIMNQGIRDIYDQNQINITNDTIIQTIIESKYDLYSNTSLLIKEFLDKNPGFKDLLFVYNNLREEMFTELVNDTTAQKLADCIREVTRGE